MKILNDFATYWKEYLDIDPTREFYRFTAGNINQDIMLVNV
jgi:hypothetical protein